MPDKHEKMYEILLGIQKQIGDISRETGEQTKSLADLNTKVATANGRTSKNEERIEKLEMWRSYLLGAFVVASAVGLYVLKTYTTNITNETSQKVISILEDKYNVEIK